MSDDKGGLGDAQGTRVGAPDQSKSATPAAHNDGPSGRPERTTGAGSEPTIHTGELPEDVHKPAK